MRQVFTHSLAPLFFFSVALTAILTLYLAAELTPSASFEVVASFGWSLLLAIWIVSDARQRSGVPVFDFGFYCYVFLPVVFPWYCFWSRGWRGGLTLCTVIGIWLAPYFVASLVWYALYG